MTQDTLLASLVEKMEGKKDVYDDDVDFRNDKYRIEGYNKGINQCITIIKEAMK